MEPLSPAAETPGINRSHASPERGRIGQRARSPVSTRPSFAPKGQPHIRLGHSAAPPQDRRDEVAQCPERASLCGEEMFRPFRALNHFATADPERRETATQLKNDPFASPLIPEGMPEISRWLSAATPPEYGPRLPPHPGGMPEVRPTVGDLVRVNIGRSLPSLQDGMISMTFNRWCRCAQPPANFCDPYRGRAMPHPEPRADRGMYEAQFSSVLP